MRAKSGEFRENGGEIYVRRRNERDPPDAAVFVNDRPHPLAGPTSLTELLGGLGLAEKGRRRRGERRGGAAVGLGGAGARRRRQGPRDPRHPGRLSRREATMRIIVISPEPADPREVPAMEGSSRPGLSATMCESPAGRRGARGVAPGLPAHGRPRLVLHEHHCARREARARRAPREGPRRRGQPPARAAPATTCPRSGRPWGATTRSSSGPCFPSLSKRGHGPAADFPWEELKAMLTRGRTRHAASWRSAGLRPGRLGRCFEPRL